MESLDMIEEHLQAAAVSYYRPNKTECGECGERAAAYIAALEANVGDVIAIIEDRQSSET